MLVAVVVTTILAGGLLWYSMATRLSSQSLARWGHRLLAVATLVVAWVAGGTLIAGSALIVAICGLLSARVPDRSLGIMLFVVHLAGALSLLILLGIADGPR